ncbi:hypothetical protein K8R66_03170 [bacterium]|nr:hypothetical protein [bacterium]
MNKQNSNFEEPKLNIPPSEKINKPEEKEEISSPEKIKEGEENIEQSESYQQAQASIQQKSKSDDEESSPAFINLKKEVENIMEEGLEDLYINLPADKQLEFKIKGEETATNISKLLMKTKVKMKKIVNLIVDWLKIIPGVNKFFLKQSAKIKTDKLLEIENKNK